MTLREMFVQGDFLQLAVMVILFVLWIVMIFKLGNGIAAREAAAGKGKQTRALHHSGSSDNNAVTAAISAAVNEYRKKQ